MAETSVMFRDATERDLPAIVDMLADDFLGARRGEDPGAALGSSYLSAFRDIQSDPNNRLVVGEREGVVIACYQLTFAPGLAYRGARRAIIEGVRVARPLRGRGYGRALMAHAIADARTGGARFIQLATNKQRQDARRFYEAIGFTPSHEGFTLEI